MKNIELKNSFEDYVVNELASKLHELDPEEYESYNGEPFDVAELLDLLLEDEYINGCYYIYTEDSEKVFKKYFGDILFICNSFYRGDLDQLDLEASTLLLLAIEHAFMVLLEKVMAPETRFTRGSLETIAGRITNINHDDLVQLINF